jgi:hypothetical protein
MSRQGHEEHKESHRIVPAKASRSVLDKSEKVSSLILSHSSLDVLGDWFSTQICKGRRSLVTNSQKEFFQPFPALFEWIPQ